MDLSEFQDFSFIGGWLCLDFTNTADGDINTDWTERLESYAHLVAWGQQMGILDGATAAQLQDYVALHPAEAEAVLNQARDIRLTIHRIFAAVSAGQEPQPEVMSAFNHALAETMEHMQIVPQSGDFAWDWKLGNAVLERVLWPVVWSAAELLLSRQHHRVRECNGRDCSWLFVDTSRNHSRRWCKMDGCGNREKARVHYRRVKGSV
jgi:predicted RNA-binding Zn ribbon-like protein